ncbi:hypothetical protein [Massilia sp. CF038]|uniref:hypothetical protein n=1 Tax=Massilia sp. CF038 TaxID=1881045 RepID=UPI00091F3002|nr:hypothetical protein [Massilia sp. CF038]SHG58181.1 hypothetical protein SAMN05428948_1130 [Massilia sp. CF038]
MNKLMSFVLLAAAMGTGGAHAAESVFTWKSQALDKQLGTPVEGVKFSWTFTDQIGGKTSTASCLSNSEGVCEVKVTADKGFFSGSKLIGVVTYTKEGFDPIGVSQWLPTSDPLNKSMLVKLTNLAEVKRQEAVLAAGRAEVEDLRIQLAVAEDGSGVECANKAQCDKLFALTEIYINKASDMKIQTATATTIETFNPLQLYAIGMSAYRMPGKGDSSVVSVKTHCKEDGDLRSKACLERQVRIVNMFKPFIDSSLKK